MKVYYVSSELQGCYAVRCLLPLQANGWDGDQTSIVLDRKTPDDKAKAALDADVVVFHRPDHPGKLKLAQELKKQGKKIVFDNDDTLKDDGGFKFNEFLDKERFEKGIAKMNDTVDEFIKLADLCTCSTDFLAEEYRKLNPNVVVLPNCIDPFYFDTPKRNKGDKLRVGIVGSIAITSDMEVLKPIVMELQKHKDITTVMFSLPPKGHDKITKELYSEEYAFWDSVDVEWQPFVGMEEYYDTLNSLRLDVMIIPRADNYFNRCKSNVKFLEASMFEIPVIAQGFPDGNSPYERNPDDAKNMIIVKDNSKWIDEILKLKENKELRLEIGRKAREYVLENYDIEKNAHKWEEAYRKLWK